MEGSCWEVLGGAGVIRVSAAAFLGPGEAQNGWSVQLSLTDLSVFEFEGRENNFSKWKDGLPFVTAMKKGSERMISDRSLIKVEMEKMGLEFVLRIAVVMIGGNKLAVSLGAAPVTMNKLKTLCTRKGVKLESARIPVMEMKLPGKGSGNVKRVDFWVSESVWPEGPRGWLLYPLVEMLEEGASSSVGRFPESESVRREMWERFRAMYLPSNVGDIFKYYDTVVVDEVEKTSLEWPGVEKRPKERWPKYRRLDGSVEESESEGRILLTFNIKDSCS